MKYQVEIYRNGVTQAPGPEMFYLRDWDKQYTLCTYVFVLKSQQHTMLVDTGCGNIDSINKMLAEEFGGKISFDLPEEETISAIVEKANINPEKVDHVFVSHLHHDHASNLAMFPNARVVVSRRGIFEYLKKRRPYFYNDILYPPEPVQHIVALSPDQIVYVDQEAEVLPGIRCFWVGGHTPGCMAVQVDTAKGRVVFTSDVAFFEENVTSGHPIGMFYNLWECHEAYKKIRAAADHIITSHDPGVLERFPGGKI